MCLRRHSQPIVKLRTHKAPAKQVMECNEELTIDVEERKEWQQERVVKSEPPPEQTSQVTALKMRIKRKKSFSSSSHNQKDSRISTPSASPIGQEKLEQREKGTWVRTVAAGTTPDALGPCEPGTNVTLEGIVWNETSSGVLVVNVTWRGKSYVGTLLDCSRHDWAPPRLSEGGGVGDNSQSLQVTQSKGRNGQKRRLPALPAPSQIKTGQTSDTILQPLSPVLRPCPCASCGKRFSEGAALKFHQTAAHPSTQNTLTSAETESLQQLFQVVEKTKGGDIPRLDRAARDERARDSCSPGVYSDISDDAPVLHKQIPGGVSRKKAESKPQLAEAGERSVADTLSDSKALTESATMSLVEQQMTAPCTSFIQSVGPAVPGPMVHPAAAVFGSSTASPFFRPSPLGIYHHPQHSAGLFVPPSVTSVTSRCNEDKEEARRHVHMHHLLSPAPNFYTSYPVFAPGHTGVNLLPPK